MDSVAVCIMLGPVAVYLLLLGLINLSSRPFLTSGMRDGATLAIALSGLIVVGPLRLLVPETALYRFGGLVWLMLLALYALGATLVLLLSRPRLVVYNVTPDQLRPVLATVVQQVDDQARWAGDSLLLPRLGVHLHLESFRAMRNIQLVSSGPGQDLPGWRKMERELRRELASVAVRRSMAGAGLMAVSLLMGLMLLAVAAADQPNVAQRLSELLGSLGPQ